MKGDGIFGRVGERSGGWGCFPYSSDKILVTMPQKQKSTELFELGPEYCHSEKGEEEEKTQKQQLVLKDAELMFLSSE